MIHMQALICFILLILKKKKVSYGKKLNAENHVSLNSLKLHLEYRRD